MDRKLNVFALANGMDLDRRGEARVLQWYRDGMERCVRVEPGEGDGTWAVRATAARDTRTRAPEIVRTLESALAVDDVLARFKELLAGAMDAANAITREEGSALP
jgi:hypothetical protein